jgi:hypothetical protein
MAVAELVHLGRGLGGLAVVVEPVPVDPHAGRAECRRHRAASQMFD